MVPRSLLSIATSLSRQQLESWSCYSGFPSRGTVGIQALFQEAFSTGAHSAQLCVGRGSVIHCRRPPHDAGLGSRFVTAAAFGPRTFEVVEFTSDGLIVEHKQPRSAAELGLHPRDVSLFVSDDRLTPQRATITVRDGFILFRTEAARALIGADKAILFKGKRDREFRTLVRPMMSALHAQCLLEKGEVAAVPFELTVLEILLRATTLHFDRRMAHMAWMADTVLSDLEMNKNPFSAINENMIQQLVPLEKALKSVRNDVHETQDAINRILEDETCIETICLSYQLAASRARLASAHNSSSTGSAAASGAGSVDGSNSGASAASSSSSSSNSGGGGSRSSNASSSRNGASSSSGSSSSGGGFNAGRRGSSEWAPQDRDRPSLGPVRSSERANANMSQMDAMVLSEDAADCSADVGNGGTLQFIGGSRSGVVSRPPEEDDEDDDFGTNDADDVRTQGKRSARARKPHKKKSESAASKKAAATAYATRILETYEREVASLAAGVMEMGENLDTTRTTWGMQLDSARNHMILLNMYLTTASISVMLAAVMPTFLGMNMQHGLPDSPYMFWGIVAGSLTCAVVSYPLCMHFYRTLWQRSSAEDVRRLQTLRLVLMQHLDDLDDIVSAFRGANQKFNRQQFQEHLRQAMPHSKLTRGAMDLLFSQFDSDRDGLIEVAELVQHHMSSAAPLKTADSSINHHTGLNARIGVAQGGGGTPVREPLLPSSLGGNSHLTGLSMSEPWNHHAWSQHQVRVQQDTQELVQSQWRNGRRAGGGGARKGAPPAAAKVDVGHGVDDEIIPW